MPTGKPAGHPCIQLDHELRCRIFGSPERPTFCAGLQPDPTMCGTCRDDALHHLTELEAATRP